MGSNPVWCTIFLFWAVDDSVETASKARLVRALLFLMPASPSRRSELGLDRIRTMNVNAMCLNHRGAYIAGKYRSHRRIRCPLERGVGTGDR